MGRPREGHLAGQDEPLVTVANDLQELSVWKNDGKTENMNVLRKFFQSSTKNGPSVFCLL